MYKIVHYLLTCGNYTYRYMYSRLTFTKNRELPYMCVQYVIIEITYIYLYTLPFENIGCAATDRKIVLCYSHIASLLRERLYINLERSFKFCWLCRIFRNVGSPNRTISLHACSINCLAPEA